MRAVLCEEYGGPDRLVVAEVDAPSAPPGHVVVTGHAWGVNLPDHLAIAGKYQVRAPTPFSPGVELSGIIRSVGEGVTDLEPGMRVAAHPVFGAMAEEAIVPANRVFPIPDSINFEDAAAMLINFGTSFNALKRRGRLQPGETLVVLGAGGGVGLAAVELGAAMGARVIAVASTTEKLAVCRSRGASDLVSSADGDVRAAVERLVGPRGVDVVCDPVGGDLAEPLFRSLAIDGRYLVVGFASGRIPSFPLNLPLLKLTSIVGVHWGPWLDARPEASAVDMAELFGLHAAGHVRPHVSARYDLADAAAAIAFVAARRSVGKVILTVGEHRA